MAVTDGTNTASVVLLGQYTARQFASASDGRGGTLIGDPALAAVADHTLATVVTHSMHDAPLMGTKCGRKSAAFTLREGLRAATVQEQKEGLFAP
jgi:hypothetical protein